MKRIGLWLLILPAVILSCALCSLGLPLPAPFPPPWSAERNAPAAILTGMVGIGYLTGLGVVATLVFLHAGRTLDPLMEPLGLSGKAYLGFGRQYHGVLQGHPVTLTYVPPQAIQPAQLNVYVGTQNNTRIAIGQRRPILDCRACPRLDANIFELTPLQIYAEDQAISQKLLSDPKAAAALKDLLTGPTSVRNGAVYIQPGRVWLYAHPHATSANAGRLSSEPLERWLADLLVLAETGEKIAASPLSGTL